MDFSYVNTQELTEGDGDLSSLFGSDRSQSRRDLPPIWSEVIQQNFLTFWMHTLSCMLVCACVCLILAYVRSLLEIVIK